MRYFLPPMASLIPGSYDLYSPRLRLAVLPRASLRVSGDFEGLIRPILEGAMKNAGRALDVPENHIVIPVHELQVSHILDKFEEATVYPEEFSVPARAQQSIHYLISTVSYLIILFIRPTQFGDSSRNLTLDASEIRARDQANVRGSPHHLPARISALASLPKSFLPCISTRRYLQLRGCWRVSYTLRRTVTSRDIAL